MYGEFDKMQTSTESLINGRRLLYLPYIVVTNATLHKMDPKRLTNWRTYLAWTIGLAGGLLARHTLNKRTIAV